MHREVLSVNIGTHVFPLSLDSGLNLWSNEVFGGTYWIGGLLDNATGTGDNETGAG